MHILESINEVPISRKWASEYELRSAAFNFYTIICNLTCFFKSLVQATSVDYFSNYFKYTENYMELAHSKYNVTFDVNLLLQLNSLDIQL